jgi:hypothetical protein
MADKFKYRVEQDGKVVWTGHGPDASIKQFPPDLRGRPESGERRLFVNDELIATQRTQQADDEMRAAQQAAEAEQRLAWAREILRAEGVGG